nr:13488_t:CDS:2 [Entrophospora candida]
MDYGIEMKECEGCYCQIFASKDDYDFCSGCIGCENLDCPWGCCDCYSDGKQVIQNAQDMIEEIKDYEDTDDMLTAKKIKDVKRGKVKGGGKKPIILMDKEEREVEKGEEKPSWIIEQEEKEKRGCYDWCANDFEKDSFLSDCCQAIIKEYHVLSNKNIIQANYSCPKCGKGYYIIKDTEYSHHGEIILRELQEDLSNLEMKILGEVKGDKAIIYLQPESCCSLADEYERDPIKLPLIQLPASTKDIKYFDYFPSS